LNDYFCNNNNGCYGDFGFSCPKTEDAIFEEDYVWVSLIFIEKNNKVIPTLVIDKQDKEYIDLTINYINEYAAKYNITLDS